jgi:hypothetical protein
MFMKSRRSDRFIGLQLSAFLASFPAGRIDSQLSSVLLEMRPGLPGNGSSGLQAAFMAAG